MFWQFERDVLDGSIVARSDHNLEAGECTVKRLVRDITVTDVNLVLSTGQFASVGRKNFSTVHNDGGNDITDRVVFPRARRPVDRKNPIRAGQLLPQYVNSDCRLQTRGYSDGQQPSGKFRGSKR